jgi:hypothetical protein
MTDVEILRKLIDLIPLVYNNPGIRISKLKDLANFKSERDLVRVLDGIKMFGTLPYSPGDLIDVYFEEDRVYIDFPQGLERPFRLGSEEWALVWKVISDEMSLHTDTGASMSVLKSILNKIPTIPLLMDPETGVDRRRDLIERAMREDRRVRFRYQRIGSAEAMERTIDPWVLFTNAGNTYLLGYCHLREALRIFHLSRMDHLTLTDLRRETKMDDGAMDYLESSPIFQRENGIFRVSLAFDPKIAGVLDEALILSEIGDYDSDDSRFEGWFMAEASVPDLNWLTALIRSLGKSVIILAPNSLRETFLNELNLIPIPK